MTPIYHTPGILATRLGVQWHHIARLMWRKLIPFIRAGRFHLIAEADVPRVRAECIRAGYLKPQREVTRV
ncbi:MAG TPA: hypothetical protein VKE74_17545 [Gemmataceae bacterium]|nr:hypothetical protein [Gemmataceae bacterium]